MIDFNQSFKGTSNRAGSSRLEKSGYLFRKGIFKNWIKRYITLELNDDGVSATLYYHINKGMPSNGSYHLAPTTRCDDSKDRHFCFYLSDSNSNSSSNHSYFAAENAADKESWTETINTTLSIIKRHHRKNSHCSSIGNNYDSSSNQGKNHCNDNDDGDNNIVYSINDEMAQYQARPIIHFKVIRANNIIDKDKTGSATGNLPDPYVQISVGSSSVKTTTRKKNINPEWGMIFQFDWDSSSRYAKIEVRDDDQTNPHGDFLGSISIPLFHLYNDCNDITWHNLCKRSVKSTIRGKLELEYRCTDFPGPDINLLKFFREVLHMSDMHVPFVSAVATDSSSAVGSSTYSSFPSIVPPLEAEVMQDFSSKVQMIVSSSSAGRYTSRGVVFLTNYRLIFVSIVRLRDRSYIVDDAGNCICTTDANSSGCEYGEDFNNLDATMYIPISTIVDVAESVDNENQSANHDMINIKTVDGKQLSLLFYNDVMYNTSTTNCSSSTGCGSSGSSTVGACTPSTAVDLEAIPSSSKLVADMKRRDSKRYLSIVDSMKGNSSGQHIPRVSRHHHHHHEYQSNDIVGVSKSWQYLNRFSNLDALEGLHSEDGVPSHRIYNNLFHRKVNKENDRLNMLHIHSELLNVIMKSSTKVNQYSKHTDHHDTSAVDAQVSHACPEGGNSKVSSNHTFRMYHSVNALKDRANSVPSDMRKLMFDSMEHGWSVYDPMKEFKRMGIPDSHIRISTANSHYQLCSTYPAIVAVPNIVDDGTLAAAAMFRSRNRFPAMCWRNSSNMCTLSRCSQPLVGPLGNRNSNDEYCISSYKSACYAINNVPRRKSRVATTEYTNDTSTSNSGNGISIYSKKNVLIVDARPYVNAAANQAAGKGYESDKNYESCSIVFMDIPNIHSVRKSLELLHEACSEESHFYRNLEQSGWLDAIGKILKGALRCVHAMTLESLSVVVHCSDGWDRTSQLTSLSMLLLDPYYRTMRGFMILVEQEWLSFGHKFAERSGWGGNGFKDEEVSPIFHQFLDCVYQIITQFPTAFEFNEQLLLFLLQHLYTGWFGTFLFNSEKERKEYGAWQHSVSIWSVPLNNIHMYANKNYTCKAGYIVPVVSKQKIVLWCKCFSSWHDKLYNMAYYQDLMHDDCKDSSSSSSGGSNSNGAMLSMLWSDDKIASKCNKCYRVFNNNRKRYYCKVCGYVYCEYCCSELHMITTISALKMTKCCLTCSRKINLLNIDEDVSDELLLLLDGDKDGIIDVHLYDKDVCKTEVERDKIIFQSYKLKRLAAATTSTSNSTTANAAASVPSDNAHTVISSASSSTTSATSANADTEALASIAADPESTWAEWDVDLAL